MAITVRDVLDEDLPRACEMEVAAYADNPLNPILFPGPFPPNSREHRIESLIQTRKSDPTTRYIKAVDDESGQQIAFAKWHVYDTSETAASTERSVPAGPGTNKQACKEFFGGLAKRKKEIWGNNPHIYLHMLHTDPKHQGRGAGGMLIEWGLKKADELSLPIYLESSPPAHRFYQSHGFEDLEEYPLDLSKYGGAKQLWTTPLMIRKPKTAVQAKEKENTNV